MIFVPYPAVAVPARGRDCCCENIYSINSLFHSKCCENELNLASYKFRNLFCFDLLFSITITIDSGSDF